MSLTKSPRNGLIVALVLGASLSIALSTLLELPLQGALGAAGFATIFPLFEEFCKGLSIFLVAWFMWKTIPSRRYGAMLGASAGLGFAIVENIIFNIGSNGNAEAIVARWLGLPFMHVMWSSFVGVGIFVLMAQRKVTGTASWLAYPIMFFGWAAHMVWNGLAIGFGVASVDIIAIVVLNVIIDFVPFALVLRDFLGGHFNFWDFLAPVQDRVEPPPMMGPSPTPAPPPPPPPA